MTGSASSRVGLRRIHYRLLGRVLVRVGYHRPHKVLSEDESLQRLLETRASLGRLNDGEIGLIYGADLYFQRYHPELARRLVRAVRTHSEGFMVGMPNVDALRHTTPEKIRGWRGVGNRAGWLVRRHAEYVSANLTRPATSTRFSGKVYYERFRRLWQGCEVVLANRDPDLASHPMLANARRVQFVASPPRDAFDRYGPLRDEIAARMEAAHGNSVALLSIGPTATVLAHELSARGMRALDIGQIAGEMDYVLSAARRPESA